MKYDELRQLFFIQYGIGLGEKIAQGGSGTVYAIEGDETHVIKIMDINENAKKIAGENESYAKLLRQALLEICQDELTVNEKLAKTRSDYMVYINKPYTIVSESKDICLCAMQMPYYETLRTFHKSGRCREEMIIRLGMHIAEALKVLHFDAKEVFYRRKKDRLGIILHMDLKPDNIFYQEENGQVIFKLGDFGATVDKVDEMLFATSDGYNAPETDADDAIPTEQADVFSLGMVIYFCCLQETDEKTLFRKVKEFRTMRCKDQSGEKPEKCSEPLWKVILKATEAEKENRYQSAEEMLSDLQQIGNEKARIAAAEKENAETIAKVAGTIAAIEGAFIIGQKIADKFKGETATLTVKEFGDIYEGNIKNGLPHGKGTYIYECNGEKRRITGKWKWVESEVIKKKTGVYVYTGMMCGGERRGWCSIMNHSGTHFRGVIEKDVFQKGIVKFIDGTEREITAQENITL